MDSLIVDWLEENSYRAYPLRVSGNLIVPGTSFSLENIILDASLVYTDSTPTTVYLESVAITGANASITVTGLDPFVIPNYLSAVYPFYRRNSNGSLLVVGEGLTQIVSNKTFSNVEFEDRVIKLLSGPWKGVSSLQFNESAVLTGALTWNAGYQFKVDVNDSVITLGANKNFGIPISCETFFNDIVNDCPFIISYVNGVTPNSNPGTISLNAGEGIAIYNDPDNHRIFIGLKFNSKDICLPPSPNPSANTV